MSLINAASATTFHPLDEQTNTELTADITEGETKHHMKIVVALEAGTTVE